MHSPNAVSTNNGRVTQVHNHLSQVASLIKKNDLPQAIAYLDENVPRTIINKLHGQVYHIENENERITPERKHRDFGKVAFRKLDGWDMDDYDRLVAISKIQKQLPNLLAEKSHTPKAPQERQVAELRSVQSALLKNIQALFDANSPQEVDEATKLFSKIASDKQSDDIRRSVHGLITLRDDEKRVLREWHKLDKLSEIHTRAEAAHSCLSSELFEKIDDAYFGGSPALLLAAYCKKYPRTEAYLYPLQLLTEIDIEAECKAMDNREAIKRDPLLRKDYEEMSSICKKEENKKLNGFDSVSIFDATLVPVRSGSFLNANRVDLMDSAFIATQAPLANTVQDFWQMVIDQNSRSIVSLNDCFDDVREVIRYCPDEIGSKLVFGDITVELQEPITVVSKPDWKLEEQREEHGIKHRKLVITQGDQQHELSHFQYMSWPDGHIPVANCAMRLIDMVAQSQDQGKTPIVVHCRAGVGRTGLFMVLYDQIMRLKAGLPLDIKQCINDLRDPLKGRSLSMMQNLTQYTFAYQLPIKFLKGEGA
ncbi:MAG: dual specificity protein phosphatase family protein [Verrucomicrobia bacterium]|nr:dual specificity protein phosphatase family protein [Verrucomicrobiota bacterium]